jgi:hypothetical protein
MENGEPARQRAPQSHDAAQEPSCLPTYSKPELTREPPPANFRWILHSEDAAPTPSQAPRLNRL